ncbi:MAG: DUF2934 domain-containing protein [Alphaproteobacteria bacterium]|nr:DUF2934 domain-containing protein [Alphaproteobacteria bacterium]MDE1987366.1 DUF2934 domain-containing protein [Alphaproteobacteria bacterium]MDE2162736.1 DUF2934 domain-containing protein [Alphaproteobacteria bacterium]MDE2267007.1 DUF2934 domain-containing protein [Alphaproteobacteria bacterium]MDE2500594.1 DUF2934 domain-containing protein [Alphaproteobacteria bacterium]
MAHDMQTKPSDEEIRVRSYLIWEREGHPEGKSAEHWLRAKAELDAEYEAKCRAASLDGASTTFVLPLLPISSRPSRTVSIKLSSAAEAALPNVARQ